MLTGRLAFPGDTLSDTIASILQGEPDWRALPETTPAGIRRLLRRCLEKDPARRLRDIGDARIEIEDVLAVRLPLRRRRALSHPATIRPPAMVDCGGRVARGARRHRRADVGQSERAAGTDDAAANLAHDDRIVWRDGGRAKRQSQPCDYARRHACRLYRQWREANLRPPARSTRGDGHRHGRCSSELGLRHTRWSKCRIR